MVRTGKRYRKSRVQSHYDVVLIGSGAGSLTCAALLAKLGKKVCVLEQHYTAGGYTHVYEREGFEWDVGVHYLGEVHKPWTVLRKVFDYITDEGLKWAEMDPLFDQVVIGEKQYDYVAGREAYTQALIEKFPEEKDVIKAYISLLYKASKVVSRYFAGQALPRLPGLMYNRLRHLVLPEFCYQSTYEVLSKLTDNKELIAVLTAQWGDYGLPPKRSSFLMHAMVAKHYINGGSYPVGGSVQIAKQIISVIEANGSDVFTYAKVEEVLVKRGRAYGVRLADGHEIYADEVVSGAGMVPTYKYMLPASVAKRYGLLEQLKNVTLSSSHLCVYAGFNGDAQKLGIPKKNYWIYPSYEHDVNVDRFNNSLNVPFPLVYISFPSAKDPSWSKRYPNRSTCEIVAPCKPEWFEQWEGTSWGKRGEDYEALKTELMNKLLEQLYKQLPQLKGALAFAELSTPLSTKWFQANVEGEIYGLEHTPDRFEQNWIHPSTPIKGLYLTGADVVTAGVGGAVMAGVLTTSCMLGWQGYKVLQFLK